MKIQNASGSIIAMAFPESFVTLTNEGVSKITPYLGIGNKNGVKAGHAALCTVNHTSGEIYYYDFGRYVTPNGKGRVRSVKTDEELLIPITAKMQGKDILNLEEILIWLHAHPEKTRGDGVLVASVCSSINLKDAHSFIKLIHDKGSIPYGVFVKHGSNCARFTFDTLIASCEDPTIIKKLAFEKIITPSPLGTISKVSSSGYIYKVKNGEVKKRKPYSTISSWKYFFDKPKNKKERGNVCTINNANYLDGVGSGALFTIEDTGSVDEYLITRYTESGSKNCQNIFIPDIKNFTLKKPYQFVYDSNCDHCHIEQGGHTYRFNKKQTN
ncbi:MAG: hypothetical protein ACI870_000459 [Crocinitomicaceae bacterium]|jgi:hypothetical protein